MSTITRPAVKGPSPPTGGLWTSEELASVFRVGAATIRSWHKAGRLPGAIRIGNQWLWRPDDIETLIASAASTTTT